MGFIEISRYAIEWLHEISRHVRLVSLLDLLDVIFIKVSKHSTSFFTIVFIIWRQIFKFKKLFVRRWEQKPWTRHISINHGYLRVSGINQESHAFSGNFGTNFPRQFTKLNFPRCAREILDFVNLLGKFIPNFPRSHGITSTYYMVGCCEPISVEY